EGRRRAIDVRLAPLRWRRPSGLPAWYDRLFSRIATYADCEQLRDADRARGRRSDLSDLQPPRAAGPGLSRDRPPPVLDENRAREPAPPRGRPFREGRRRGGVLAVGREEQR